MAKRRRKKGARRDAGSPGPPVLTGIALLLSETPSATLDLHGFTANQARARLRDFVRTQAALASGRVIHVVTGRGNRSEGKPVLPGVVREELDGGLEDYVGEQAGLPGGGGVAIRLR